MGTYELKNGEMLRERSRSLRTKRNGPAIEHRHPS